MKFTLLKGALGVMLLASATLIGAVVWEMRGAALPTVPTVVEGNSAEVERGADLARAGAIAEDCSRASRSANRWLRASKRSSISCMISALRWVRALASWADCAPPLALPRSARVWRR